MRILFYGINYAPEITGIGKYTSEMCSYFALQGHTVHVITAMPYYPQWEKEKEYKSRLWHTENINGVKIFRSPLFVPRKINAWTRVIHEISFSMSSFLWWLKLLFSKKYDSVISISPPFHLGIVSLLYSWLRRTPVIVHIQDLQIDVAKGLGLVKNAFLLKLMFRMEKAILKKCAAVTTISLDMRKKIISKGIPAQKCFYLPNWVDEKKIRPLEKRHSLRDKFGINASSRVVLFSGSLGEKHGLGNMIECAKMFRHDSDILFVIVGSGEEWKGLHLAVAEAMLRNVLFFPLQTYDDLSALLAIADLHLILLKRIASDLVMPSKLTSVLAAGGVPVVTAVKGSNIHTIVTKYNLGIVVEPDNVEELVKGIREGLSMDLKPLALNARSYAVEFLSKKAIMQQWESMISKVAAHPHQPATKKRIAQSAIINKGLETDISNG